MRIVDLAGSEKFQISSKLDQSERELRTQVFYFKKYYEI